MTEEPGAPSPPAGASARDRWILGLFAAYAILLLVAAFAQVTDNRPLLDLLDFRRIFTR
jgi:hypothetical protein